MNAWANAMLLWSWQSLWIVAVTAVGLKAVRLKSPSVRHSIWFFAITAIAILPAANFAVQKLEVVPAAVASITSIPAVTSLTSVTPVSSIATLTSVAQLPAAVVIEQTPSVSAGQTSPASIFFGLWGLGVAVSGARVFRNWRRARRIAVSAEISRHGEIETPIAYSALTSTPMIVGLLRPIIVLPADIHAWATSEESRAMLSHEMAHLRRRDHYVGLLQAALGAVCFFHPAVRYALREVAVERELACDETVLASGVCANLYGEALLRVAERSVRGPDGYSPSFGATGKVLERRIHMILNHRAVRPRNPNLARLFTAGGALAMMVLAVLLLPQGETLARPTQDAPPQIRLATVNPLGIPLMLAAVVREAAAEPVRAETQAPSEVQFQQKGQDLPLVGNRVLDLLQVLAVAQPTQVRLGTLSGTIVDSLGGFIPGAAVTLTSADGSVKTAVTNGAGLFELQQIDAGRYTLRASLPGFMTVERPVFVGEGTSSAGDITLPLGSVSTFVEVSTARPASTLSPTTQSRRLGGDVAQANLVSAPKPIFPPLARATGAEGTVRLLAVIDRSGAVTSLQVDTTRPGTGNPDLINAAMDAVRQWRYRPAILNGQPVEVATAIQVNFTLVD